jgi:hypothetical protein
MDPEPSGGIASRATGWVSLSADPRVATYSYSFGLGEANALLVAVRGGVAIVSPPAGVPPAAMDAAAAFGEIRAIVAPNAFHHLGIPAWHRRFPEAPLYAPSQSIPRLVRRTGIREFRPISEATDLGGGRVEFVDMPHYRTGEILVEIHAAGGNIWYVTDAIFNLPGLPANPIVACLFKWSGSAPGLRLNRIAPLFMMRDRAALWRWLRGELERREPRWLVPAHGGVADLVSVPTSIAELFSVSGRSR